METAEIQRLREAFLTAGYTEQALCERLGLDVVGMVQPAERPRIVWSTREKTKLDLLIRLFFAGSTLDPNEAVLAIEPSSLPALAEEGLLTVEGQSVSASLRLYPFGDLLFLSDWMLPGQPRSSDIVMGLGSSTRTLAAATIRRPWHRVLDVGTGGGVHAILAASHSDHVVGSDVNRRGLRMARFAATLNGVTNVEFREGSWYEPAQGEKFDLIVSNPPFVISPEHRYLYRDGGMRGDLLCRMLLREAPQYLEEGGYCQLLGLWANQPGRDWTSVTREWFSGTGCDAWVLRGKNTAAPVYAESWLRSEATVTDSYDDWMAYLERENIESIGLGLITLRRRSGVNWFRADDAPEEIDSSYRTGFELGFALRDWLEDASDGALLGACLRVNPAAELHQHGKRAGASWAIDEAEIRLTRGIRYRAGLDSYMLGFISRCDGNHPIGGLVAQLADVMHRDPSQMVSACLPVVRSLVEKAILLPEGIGE